MTQGYPAFYYIMCIISSTTYKVRYVNFYFTCVSFSINVCIIKLIKYYFPCSYRNI